MLGLYGTSPSGALRLIARPLPQREEFVFTPNDSAVVIQESGGLARTALADGARQPLPITTDGPFDAQIRRCRRAARAARCA